MSDALQLYPDDFASQELKEFKCTICGCINCFYADDPRIAPIMRTGYGLRRVDGVCLAYNCKCHMPGGKRPRILMRTTTVEELFV